MQKSYIVKSPINFANFAFFVRVGDILMHDTSNGNKLTVYRSGEIVKAITQTALGVAALLKQGFIAEVLPQHSPAIVAPKPPEAAKKTIPAPIPDKRKDKPKPKLEPEPVLKIEPEEI